MSTERLQNRGIKVLNLICVAPHIDISVRRSSSHAGLMTMLASHAGYPVPPTLRSRHHGDLFKLITAFHGSFEILVLGIS